MADLSVRFEYRHSVRRRLLGHPVAGVYQAREHEQPVGEPVQVPDRLPVDWLVGREFDRGFLADLPDGVDPCGEHGEFHTFVRDAPAFDERVAVEPAETVTRDLGDRTFHYCELA